MKRKIIFQLIAFICIASNANAQQWGDYTLYSTKGSNNVYLVDTNGTTYKTWTFSNAPTEYSTYMTPGGIFWRAILNSGNSMNGGGITGRIQKFDYSGTILWDFVYSSTTYCLHHDICPLPNGNILLISYEKKTAANATAAGCSSSIEIWSEKIIEVQPTGYSTGTIVWEWHLWDHLVQNYDPSKANYQSSIVNNPQLVNINYQTTKDWVHMNSLDYNPILDQIVCSSHMLNELWVIDHSTTTAEAASHSGGLSGKGGDILYRWGNPAAYSATGTAVINVAHDAHWIPEGSPNAGRLVVFNNLGVSTNQSTIDQIAPPINGYNYNITLGSAYNPTSYTERRNTSGGSQSMSSSEQLPNGNMLICMALSGLIYEISSGGTTLWSKTVSGACPQAKRYQACMISNSAPALPIISENAGTLTSTSATTYQWYFNGVQIPGATSQSYTPSQSGVYLVRITDAVGCVFQYSENYIFTLTATTVDLQNERNIHIYPNPSDGYFEISMSDQADYQIIVYDLSGKQLYSSQNTSQLDLSFLENGMYMIRVVSENCDVNQKILIQK